MNDNLNKNDFLNKYMVESACSCGKVSYVFIGDFSPCYYTFCLRCHKKIYHLTCKKCQSGFSYPSDEKYLNLKERYWKCDVCNFKNSFNPSVCQFIKSFEYSKIPKDIKESYKINRLSLLFIIFILLLLYILRFLIRNIIYK